MADDVKVKNGRDGVYATNFTGSFLLSSIFLLVSFHYRGSDSPRAVHKSALYMYINYFNKCRATAMPSDEKYDMIDTVYSRTHCESLRTRIPLV